MRIVKPIVFEDYVFSRASEAFYYDSNGILKTAGVDELRLGYNPSTLDYLGSIIEGEATNLFTQSNNFSHADWEKFGSPSLTSESAISPDGTLNAYLWDYDSGSEGIYQEVAAGVMRISLYVKRKTDGPMGDCLVLLRLAGTSSTFNIDPVAPSFTGTKAKIETLQNGWLRISLSETFISGTVPAQIEPKGGEFYFAFAMVELTASELLANTPTSYIASGSEPGVRAADIQGDNLGIVSSNIPEDDYDEWIPGVEYPAGSQVIVRENYHRIYEANVTSEDKYPPDNPGDWLDLGATNRWRMFDMEVGSENQTISDGSENSVEVLLSIEQPINSIILLNIYAANVSIIMRDSNSNQVYVHYQELLSPITSPSWWEWFFGGRSRTDTVVLTNLPLTRPATIEMVLDGVDGPAKIGKLILGYGKDIGCVRYGTGVGIVDFSRKVRDDFGNNSVVKRRYIDRADFDVQIPTARVDEFKNLLANVRATPVVYIGDTNFFSTVLFGYYRDFSIVISGPKRSDCTLQIESI